ncbi:MAG: VacJ family lipoprotein [Nitrospira sp.]|nr:VacJ family lipoprotein [Nitrospira sp.]MDH4305663.1 VacJ family lipoprotein [Nitrospira sp.]MDH5193393.1 VacJ family lipoprotein [Nitrospira sp.]
MITLISFGQLRPLRHIDGFVLSALLLFGSGCAVAKGSTAPPISQPELQAQPILLADASSQTPPSGNDSDASQDEPFDPFAKSDVEGMEEYDPWEPLNTKFFEFNRQLDRWILKPVAKGYNAVVPNIVQVGISNVFYNSRVTPRLLNNLFQGKFKGAGIEAGRFLINTTVGIGGFFDVAQRFNLTTPEEDTGQTLGFYGIKPGPYLMVPLLGPYTVRDLIGYGGDIALNPIYWLIIPAMHNIDAIPTVVDVDELAATYAISIGARATEIVNDRSLNLEKFQGVEESTLDLYAAVRNAYLQKRAKAVRE